MTVFQGLSQGQDYTILGTKRKKKKKKAAVGRQDIEVSSSKGFHMLILRIGITMHVGIWP